MTFSIPVSPLWGRIRVRGLFLVPLLIFSCASASSPVWADDKETQTEPPVPAPAVPSPLKQTLTETPKEEQPWYIRAIMSPIQDGMFLRLPVIDTDPNRGVTYGVMPIWVLKGDDERIQYIHAPSLTYNRTFRVTPTYRFYYFPTKDSVLNVEMSYSQVSDHNLFVKYDNYDFLDRGMFVSIRLQDNADGSGRFYGIGPETPSSAQSNYRQSTAIYKVDFGRPIVEGSNWKWIVSNEMAGDRISNGPIGSLPGISSEFPQYTPAGRNQHNFFQASLNYDSRDSPITTTQGYYANFSAETSQRSLASEYDYQRYGADLRAFVPWPGNDRYVTAGNIVYDQIIGNAPFWLMPELGGKYVFRAYGTGRYIDNGLLVGNVEERIAVDKEELAGVTTEFQVAPFMGLGSVFDRPDTTAWKDYRPVFGTAVRAIAKPQVVGSIDFGVGQEGLSTFMDIDYSF